MLSISSKKLLDSRFFFPKTSELALFIDSVRFRQILSVATVLTAIPINNHDCFPV